jgi:hypothetical protein
LYADDAVVAIRRKYGTAVYWYKTTVGELLHAFRFGRPTEILAEVLNLHETDGAKPIQLSELSTSEAEVDSVVLSGQAFVGFQESDPAIKGPKWPDTSESRIESITSTGQSWIIAEPGGASERDADIENDLPDSEDIPLASPEDSTGSWYSQSAIAEDADGSDDAGSGDDADGGGDAAVSDDGSGDAASAGSAPIDSQEGSGSDTFEAPTVSLPPPVHRERHPSSYPPRSARAGSVLGRVFGKIFGGAGLSVRDIDLSAGASLPSGPYPPWGGETREMAANGGSESRAAPEETEEFSAYPQIEAPNRIEPEGIFDLEIGLAAMPFEGVEGTRVAATLPRGTLEFNFDVQVTAERFKSDQGWSQTLRVDRNDLDRSKVVFRLTAPKLEETDRGNILALVVVHFTRAGIECGTAWRRMLVAPRNYVEPPHPGAPAFWIGAQPSAPIVNSPGPQVPVPDLTMRIDSVDGDPASGKFALSFVTPHQVPLPPSPLRLYIGQDATSFANALIRAMDKAEGTPVVELTAPGFADAIAAKLPAGFWPVVYSIADEVAKANASSSIRRPMTILLLSAEGSIPWELAWMPRPLDSKIPQYLGAQVSIGRWILGEAAPPLPPKSELGITRIAAVSAYYSKESRITQLQGALDEAKDMEINWAATPINASPQAIVDLLTGNYAVNGGAPLDFQAIHFACHGQAFPADPVRTAVLLADGQELKAFDFRRAAIGKTCSPLLFLNACQVGTGSMMMGENVGFAGCSLYAGFSAFIGPLWSVNDVQARSISHEFYTRAFKEETVGEILRDIRSRFDPRGPAGPTTTPLAYVLYGNPGLKLTLKQH